MRENERNPRTTRRLRGKHRRLQARHDRALDAAIEQEEAKLPQLPWTPNRPIQMLVSSSNQPMMPQQVEEVLRRGYRLTCQVTNSGELAQQLGAIANYSKSGDIMAKSTAESLQPYIYYFQRQRPRLMVLWSLLHRLRIAFLKRRMLKNLPEPELRPKAVEPKKVEKLVTLH